MLIEADSEASRWRYTNFYRKKHRCFKLTATLSYTSGECVIYEGTYGWGWLLWAQACSCYRCHLGFASSVQPYPHLTLPSPSLDVHACLSFDHCVHTSSMSLARGTVSLSLDGPALITEHVLLPFTLFKSVLGMIWKRLLGFRKIPQVKKLPLSVHCLWKVYL